MKNQNTTLSQKENAKNTLIAHELVEVITSNLKRIDDAVGDNASVAVSFDLTTSGFAGKVIKMANTTNSTMKNITCEVYTGGKIPQIFEVNVDSKDKKFMTYTKSGKTLYLPKHFTFDITSEGHKYFHGLPQNVTEEIKNGLKSYAHKDNNPQAGKAEILVIKDEQSSNNAIFSAVRIQGMESGYIVVENIKEIVESSQEIMGKKPEFVQYDKSKNEQKGIIVMNHVDFMDLQRIHNGKALTLKNTKIIIQNPTQILNNESKQALFGTTVKNNNVVVIAEQQELLDLNNSEYMFNKPIYAISSKGTGKVMENQKLGTHTTMNYSFKQYNEHMIKNIKVIYKPTTVAINDLKVEAKNEKAVTIKDTPKTKDGKEKVNTVNELLNDGAVNSKALKEAVQTLLNTVSKLDSKETTVAALKNIETLSKNKDLIISPAMKAAISTAVAAANQEIKERVGYNTQYSKNKNDLKNFENFEAATQQEDNLRNATLQEYILDRTYGGGALTAKTVAEKCNNAKTLDSIQEGMAQALEADLSIINVFASKEEMKAANKITENIIDNKAKHSEAMKKPLTEKIKKLVEGNHTLLTTLSNIVGKDVEIPDKIYSDLADHVMKKTMKFNESVPFPKLDINHDIYQGYTQNMVILPGSFAKPSELTAAYAKLKAGINNDKEVMVSELKYEGAEVLFTAKDALEGKVNDGDVAKKLSSSSHYRATAAEVIRQVHKDPSIDFKFFKRNTIPTYSTGEKEKVQRIPLSGIMPLGKDGKEAKEAPEIVGDENFTKDFERPVKAATHKYIKDAAKIAQQHNPNDFEGMRKEFLGILDQLSSANPEILFNIKLPIFKDENGKVIPEARKAYEDQSIMLKEAHNMFKAACRDVKTVMNSKDPAMKGLNIDRILELISKVIDFALTHSKAKAIHEWGAGKAGYRPTVEYGSKDWKEKVGGNLKNLGKETNAAQEHYDVALLNDVIKNATLITNHRDISEDDPKAKKFKEQLSDPKVSSYMIEQLEKFETNMADNIIKTTQDGKKVFNVDNISEHTLFTLAGAISHHLQPASVVDRIFENAKPELMKNHKAEVGL
jgi:hypothetical protein